MEPTNRHNGGETREQRTVRLISVTVGTYPRLQSGRRALYNVHGRGVREVPRREPPPDLLQAHGVHQEEIKGLGFLQLQILLLPSEY